MPGAVTRRVVSSGLAAAFAAAAARVGAAAPGKARGPAITPADAAAVMAAIRKPGARAVLVNVWATWCDPCREEMPDIVRFYKAHQGRGLRLVLVTADDDDTRAEAQSFLAAQGVDFPTLQKAGDDMAFINGLEPRWSGALPISILFDGQGARRHFWPGTVTYRALSEKLAEVLGPAPRGKESNSKPRRSQ